MLPAGFSCRGLGADDAPAVAALIRADEIAVLGAAYVDATDVLTDWGRPDFRLDTDAVGVVDSTGQLVAYGELSRRERFEVAVAAPVRGRGIGSALLTWVEQRAAETGTAIVGQTVPAQHREAVQLLASRGYTRRWTSWVLELPAGAAVIPMDLLPGWSVRGFRPGRDESAAYRVVEDAFGEWPDRPPVGYDEWAAVILGRPGFAPWQLLLAEAPDGSVAGVASLAVTDDGQGWIEQLAVAREWRGYGVGRALLAAGFAATRAHGARTSDAVHRLPHRGSGPLPARRHGRQRGVRPARPAAAGGGTGGLTPPRMREARRRGGRVRGQPGGS